MQNSLEKHKTFPVIAWGLFIGFAVFVFFLATQLQATAEDLALQTTHTVESINATTP